MVPMTVYQQEQMLGNHNLFHRELLPAGSAGFISHSPPLAEPRIFGWTCKMCTEHCEYNTTLLFLPAPGMFLCTVSTVANGATVFASLGSANLLKWLPLLLPSLSPPRLAAEVSLFVPCPVQCIYFRVVGDEPRAVKTARHVSTQYYCQSF